MNTKPKTRKLNFANDQDMEFLMNELRVVDPTGTLLIQLRLFLQIQLTFGRGDADIPQIQADYVKNVRMIRDEFAKRIAAYDNLIQILEEGV